MKATRTASSPRARRSSMHCRDSAQEFFFVDRKADA
jgi:hypothetical protein